MIGLGRMGRSMATRLLRGGHRVVVHDLKAEAVRAAEAQGAEGAASLGDLAARLAAPRVVWAMVPAGEPTEQTIARLLRPPRSKQSA